MEARGPVEGAVQGFVDDGRDAAPVHLLHRVDAHPERRHHRRLGRVDAAGPDHHDVGRRQPGGSRRESADARQRLRPLPHDRGQRHAVEVAARRGLGGVGVGVSVDPQQPDPIAGALFARRRRHPRDRPHRHRVIAAEDHRQPSREPDPAHHLGERLEDPRDLLEVAGALVSRAGERLDHGGGEVALVDDLAPQAPDLLDEAGVAHRRRSHVDAPAAGAEVERDPDDGHRGADGHADIVARKRRLPLRRPLYGPARPAPPGGGASRGSCVPGTPVVKSPRCAESGEAPA